MARFRILIADDHEVVRKGIRLLIEARADWNICGETSTAAETMEKVRQIKPDLLVLDINLPDGNGIDIARDVRQQYPGTEVLILTMHESGAIASEALAAGARGLVYKSDATQDLLAAIETVMHHKPFISARVTETIVKSGLPKPGPRNPMDVLTEREMEILKLLAEGKSVKEVAAECRISYKTVNVHRQNIFEKLNLRSLSDMIYFAIRHQIVHIKNHLPAVLLMLVALSA